MPHLRRHYIWPYRGRPVARCEQCHSLERGRFLWMILDRMQVLQPKMRVLHLAPEGAIGNRLFELYGSSYKATDYDVPRYSKWKFAVSRLDACTDLVNMPSASFDLILHNHVLEHVPCSVEAVLTEMTRLLAPSGWHFFPSLSGERKRRKIWGTSRRNSGSNSSANTII
jgi:Methyltransferase domain